MTRLTASPQAPSLEKPTASATLDSDDMTDFDLLDLFSANAGGCAVQFLGDDQEYLLELASPNYDGLFSLLLTCWSEDRRVSIAYRSGPRAIDSGAMARVIVSVVAVPPDPPRAPAPSTLSRNRV